MEIGHFIAGKRVAGTSKRFGDVFNPAAGKVEKKVALASKAEVRAAVLVAKAAQPQWAAQNPQKRARVIMEFVRLLNRPGNRPARKWFPGTPFD